MYGKPGPMKGKKPWTHGKTKETDPRIAELSKKVSETHKKQFREGKRTIKGEANPNYGKTREDRTPEQLENYSKAAIKRVLDGKVCRFTRCTRGKHHSEKTGKEHFFRSSLERRVMACLDKDQSVAFYETEPFSIVVAVGKRYLPDVLVHFLDSHKELWEVKPKYLVTDPEVQTKAQAGTKYCEEHGWKYVFKTLEDIKQYEHSLGIASVST